MLGNKVLTELCRTAGLAWRPSSRSRQSTDLWSAAPWPCTSFMESTLHRAQLPPTQRRLSRLSQAGVLNRREVHGSWLAERISHRQAGHRPCDQGRSPGLLDAVPGTGSAVSTFRRSEDLRQALAVAKVRGWGVRGGGGCNCQGNLPMDNHRWDVQNGCHVLAKLKMLWL